MTKAENIINNIDIRLTELKLILNTNRKLLDEATKSDDYIRALALREERVKILTRINELQTILR